MPGAQQTGQTPGGKKNNPPFTNPKTANGGHFCVPRLLQYVGSAAYFARIKVRGKTIRARFDVEYFRFLFFSPPLSPRNAVHLKGMGKEESSPRLLLRSFISGGLAGTRTRDQCLKRALLYQLSYQPNCLKIKSLQMAVGKISGAVGNASHLGPDVEEAICKRLGLDVAPVTSQVIQRDRHAQYLSALAILTATLEKIALEIRHLQRTEVREAEEPFGEGQRGSSAMPHKRNPVSSEQVCGLARVVRANAGAAFENIALWHERDISHSSVERVILPDSTILADYLLARMADIVSGMRVFPERMRRNMDATGGLVFSGQLLLDLIEAGAPREDAYKWVQEHAMAAWETDTNSASVS